MDRRAPEKDIRTRSLVPQAFYRDLIEKADLAFFVCDPEGRLIFFNEAFARLFGHDRSDLEGRALRSLIHPDDCHLIDDCFGEKAKINKDINHYHIRGVGKDGSVIFLSLDSNAIRQEGEIIGIGFYALDITLQVKTEQALRVSEREKATILESVEEIITYQDRDLKLIWGNRAAIESVNLTFDKLLGRKCYQVWAQREDPCPGCPVTRAMESGRPQESEMSTPDGRFWWIRGYPVFDEAGEVIGAVEITKNITERKAAEEAIRQSQEKYRAAVEQSADNIFLVDLDSKRILEANPALQNLLGYTREELLGMTAYDFIDHPRSDIDKKIELILEKGNSFIGERKYRCKSGSVIDVEVNVATISYRGKKALCIVSRNITERKKIETALRDAYLRYLELFDSVQEGIAITDQTEIIRLANPALAGIFGEESENNLIGKSLFAYVAQENHGILLSQAMQRKRGIASSYEIDIVAGDGNRKTILVFASPRYSPEGDYIGSFGSVIDITSRKDMENALRSSEERFRNFADAVDDIIYRYDPEVNRFDFISPSFERQTGYRLAEVEADPAGIFRGVINRDDRDRVFEAFRKQQEHGPGARSLTVDYRLTRKSGKTIWMRETRVLEFTREGQIFRVNGVITNITEQVQAEEALRQAYGELEERVRRRTAELAAANEQLAAEREALKQKNVALTEVLDQIEKGKEQLAFQVQSNIDKVAIPILCDLESQADIKGRRFISILKSSLIDIASPYLKILESKFPHLTTREIEICNMIRNGFTTKQIALTLDRSEQTVLKQRKMIRKKLRISNKKINLMTYLKNLE